MSKRWEYLTIQLKPSTWGFIKPEQVQEELTRQGRQGWELVSFAAPGIGLEPLLVFKREQG